MRSPNFAESAKTICLINPPSAFLLDERTFISLGILRVAAVLEQAGHNVEHLDLNGIENYVEATANHAALTASAVFGLTATTPQMPAAAKIVEAIRKVRPDARILLGGPHITLVNAAVRKEAKRGLLGRAHREYARLADLFDVMVAGDGENAVFEALKAQPAKLIDADDPASAMFLTDTTYNEIPFPARHLVDVSSYHYTIEGSAATSLIGQLGCPYQCRFCGGRESAMLRRIRNRQPDSIIREVEHLHREHGFRGFMFYDDELNVSRSMVELMNGLSDLQKSLGVEFRLRGFIKSNLFNDEQAEAMRRAGFRWILVGFESGSPRILSNIKKKATREQNSECVEIARRHGLKVKALMSVGHPGESEETIRETEDWLLTEKPSDFDCTVITTYPGTPYFDEAVQDSVNPAVWTYTCPENGDRLHSVEVDFTHDAAYYKGSPDDGYVSYVFTDYLSQEEIVGLRDRVERNVRAKLDIPFNPGAPGVRYEASMGQLPGYIFKRTSTAAKAAYF